MKIELSYLQTLNIMDWNALKIFLTIAEKRNLIDAAKTLNMSHSTVYRRINSFEEQLGRLFERLNGRYELTELGEKVLTQGRSIRDSFDNIERQVAGQDTQPKGLVRITAPTSFSYSNLPQYLSECKVLYPEIQLELLVTPLELNMNSRQADIALRVTSTPPEYLIGREVRRIKWGVYAHSDYIKKRGKPKNLSELANHSLIGAAGTLRNHPVFIWQDNNFASNVSTRTDDFIAMACLAAKSHGVAVLPDDLRQPELVRLFTFTPAKENQLWILTHPDLRKVERIKLVMKFLTDAFSTD
ncbi:LysR family transcriptional regulator [Agaribacter marinus]|uniref:LysR family transcriptional regulator n=1 Tax=Agaribacter marinus TaxID=1431249 RepID=A0AA37WHY2_9ALTE|nr:LysR family transcriptional regulator [Agaribacter marinus]GLR70458.1 LysR family transcriptional regulator [Agaribacter marinus]